MRIIIESDEKTPQALAPVVMELNRTDVVNAGAPAVSLIPSATVTGDVSSFIEAINAGGPPASLTQALQDSSSASYGAVTNNDAGAAPKL